MKAVSGGAIAGDVHMIVNKANGDVTKVLEFSNIVLDVGYKELVKRFATTGMSKANETTTFDLVKYLWLGTGTTEPAPGDLGLESRSGTLAGKAQLGQHSASSNYFPNDVGIINDYENRYYECWYELKYSYGEGEAEGVWTELGLGDANYANPFSRALIKDGSGAPISLTILSDEFLTVYYKIRFINEPQGQGSVTVGGQSSSVTFVPATYVTDSSYSGRYGYWNSYLSDTPDGKMVFARALSSAGYPYVSAIYPVDLNSFWSSASYSSGFSPGIDYIVSGQVIFGPTDTDILVECLSFSNSQTETLAQYSGVGYIVFDPPLNKRADYRLTLDISIDFTPHGGPVTGLADTATATTLDFTWDAYPNVTEYQLVLRQAGTVISSQTVTAPTATASFTGLTASTEYHLDIKPIATPRNGRRLIHTASTTA